MPYDTDILALNPDQYWRLYSDTTSTGGAVSTPAGITFGPAIQPDGTGAAVFERGSDNIAVATTAGLDNATHGAYAISAIIQPTLDTLPLTVAKIGGQTAGFHAYLTAGMVPALTVVASGTEAASAFANRPLVINEPANVVWRFNAGTLDIFVDGRLVASTSGGPATFGPSTAGTDIGGSGATSGTVRLENDTDFTVYTLSANVSDLAFFSRAVSDTEVFDVLFSQGAAPRSTELELTNVPDITEVRLFDLDNSLAEVVGQETFTPAGTYTLPYSVTTEIRTRLAILNVDNRLNPFYADDVILPREGLALPVDLLLDVDRVYEGTFQTPIPPSVVSAPSISGTAELGQLLTATTGTYAGQPVPTVTGQWLRNAAPIPGETGFTYTLVAADDGNVVSYRETATNLSGSVDATSNGISLAATGLVGIYRHTGGQLVGTTAAQLDFDTSDRNDTGFYTKTGGAFDLPAGRYLAFYQACWIGSGQNNRGQCVIQARLDGAVVAGSLGSTYQRDTANDAGWAAGACVVESDGTNSLDFQIFRDAGSSVGGLDPNRSHVMIVNITDATSFAHYGLSAGGAAFGAQTYATLPLSTISESGANITRSGDDVTLQPGSSYLTLGGCFFTGTTARTSRFTRFTVGGSHIPGSTGYAYMRDSSNEFGAPNSLGIVEVSGSAATLNFQARGPGPGGTTVTGGGVTDAARSGLFVVELPPGARWYASSDLVGGQSIAASSTLLNVNQTVDRNEAAIVSSGTTSQVTMAADLNLLVAAGAMVRRTSANGTRLTRETRVLVNGAETSPAAVATGFYNRGDQGSQDCYDSAHPVRGIISVTSGDTLEVSIDESRDGGWNDGGGTPVTNNTEPAGLYLLDLSLI